jgi:hypothetical protein
MKHQTIHVGDRPSAPSRRFNATLSHGPSQSFQIPYRGDFDGLSFGIGGDRFQPIEWFATLCSFSFDRHVFGVLCVFSNFAPCL